MVTGMSRRSGHESDRTSSFERQGTAVARLGRFPVSDPADPVPHVASLIENIREARRWTLALVEDLDETQLSAGDILNPFLWELGHVAWFYEHFVLRTEDLGSSCNAGSLYNSEDVLLGRRGGLALPDRRTTIEYMQKVEDAVCDEVNRCTTHDELAGLCQLALRHEDMHAETLIYARQAHGLPRPDCLEIRNTTDCSTSLGGGDVEIEGGLVRIGSDHPLAFDNEGGPHTIELRPFAISSTAVTNAEYLGFVESGGYRTGGCWDSAGDAWRRKVSAVAPLCWARNGDGQWIVCDFGEWRVMDPDHPVVHISHHEARAYCRWGKPAPSYRV